MAYDGDDVYRQTFTVSYEYPVHFTRSIFNPGNPLLASILRRGANPAQKSKILACVDSGLAEATPGLAAQIENYFKSERDLPEMVHPPYIVAGSEKAKNGWNDVRNVMASIGDCHLCRQSVVMAIGGGSVLDMVGFAASIVHRGLRLIRAPTTVLAQNDGGVGVKNGMNEHGAKNFVGTFAPPFAVVNDFDFLATLKDRDWIGGISEAFKVAIIKDAGFFNFLCGAAPRLRQRDMEAMETLIRACARLHLDHIRTSGDPFEFGSARPLDFGHWSAHKLEVMSGYEMGHGQAVSIGIALDSYYAMRMGLISNFEFNSIIEGLIACGLPVWSEMLTRPDSRGKPEILAGLEQFREHLGGILTVTLPRGIGHKCEIHEMAADIIEDGISQLELVRKGIFGQRFQVQGSPLKTPTKHLISTTLNRER